VPVPENVAAVRSRIAAACARAGRQPESVTLIAVSKTFPASAVDEAIEAGITDIGENRVQEAREKRPLVRASAPAFWHLIGHLQSNKSKEAVRLFDMIQTVDSLELAGKIARAAESEGKRQEILLEVNVGDEAQKSGATKGALPGLAAAVKDMPSLHLRGLMAIPPVGTPEQTRPYFRELRALRDELGLEHLSMGMSEDFEVAVEEGATLVRVGRAIFGSRG
jgi:pyridoxal phosphate enzyme (YggS family)